MILVNQEITKVWFRVRREGRGTREELVCTMKDGTEYEFSMNKKQADEAKALYLERYPELKMTAGLKGKLMMYGMEKRQEGEQENLP